MSAHPRHDDRGTILPLVLVVCVVLATVVAALATYASATLRFGRETEASADRLAAAQGGMDNALERIERGESPCVTQTVQNGSSVSYTMPAPLNGIFPEITCTVVDGDLTGIESHAVVLTGSNGQSGPLLSITEAASTAKAFRGNVYLEGVPVVGNGAGAHTIDLGSSLAIDGGTIRYHPNGSQTCATPPELVLNPSREVSLGAGYELTPDSCDPTVGWQRFRLLQPLQPTFATMVDRTGPARVTTAGCTVWEPGRYTAPPALAAGSYHYFRSGEYFFDDVGTWSITNAFVLAGWPGAAGPDIENNRILANGRPDPAVNGANNPCNSEWNAPDQVSAQAQGAAFYLGGSSSIVIGSNGSLEVTGYAREGYRVSVYAVEGTGASTIGGDARILSTDPGNKKQLSIRGLIWAPGAGVEFSNVANQTVAALTGGAIISELSAGAAANANNVTIGVDAAPQTSSILVSSSATNTGTTVVEAVIAYRTSGASTDYAVQSRRVVGLTPE